MFGVSVPSDVDVDEESKALRIPRLSPSSGSPDYLVSGEDIIDIKPKLWTLGAQPYPWKVNAGDEVLIDPACLSGCGATKVPIKMVGDREVLMPAGEQIVYSAYAPYTSYVAQITGDPTNGSAVAIALPEGNPKIPYQFLYLNCGIRVLVSYKHAAGALAPYLRVLLGNANSASTTTLADVIVPTAGDEITFDVAARITKLGVSNAGVFTTFGTMHDQKGLSKPLGNAYLDRAISTDTDIYVVIACFPNNQTINIQRLQVSLVP